MPRANKSETVKPERSPSLSLLEFQQLSKEANYNPLYSRQRCRKVLATDQKEDEGGKLGNFGAEWEGSGPPRPEASMGSKRGWKEENKRLWQL